MRHAILIDFYSVDMEGKRKDLLLSRFGATSPE